MRLEKIQPADKLTLDLTPLIDVVFLLVLFFAVSTSFIKPEHLAELKDSLASYKQDKSVLATQVEQYRFDKINLELAIEQSKLEQIKQVQNVQQLKSSLKDSGRAISTKDSEIEKNQLAIEYFQNKLEYFKEYQADLKAKITNEQQAVAVLTSKLTGEQRALLSSQAVVDTKNDKIHALDAMVVSLNQSINQLKETTSTLNQQIRQQSESISEQSVALIQQKTNIEQLDKEKQKYITDYNLALKLAAELKKQLNQEQTISQKYRTLVADNEASIKELQLTLATLDQNFKRLSIDEDLGLQRKQDRIIINLPDNVLFDSGHSGIKDRGLLVLEKVGRILKDKIGNMSIQVGGHTDNVPLGTGSRSRYQDNWGLSSYRAVSVVRYFQDEIGIESDQLSAAGYGFHQPIADNGTEQGRKLNRRIEIVLLPR
jgi:chemotaxis protein MotB